MPRQIATISTEGMPVWDTFEASFFLGAGLSVGIVLGILFPSLWRTFRRRFRKNAYSAPQSEKLEQKLDVTLKIMRDESEQVEAQSSENESNPLNINISEKILIAQSFVLARNYFQIGNARTAIQLYIDILTNENVSKIETNRALFELSQVYASIGLYMRAFDTAIELFYRKPKNSEILIHILNICAKGYFPEKLNSALNIYKGSPDKGLRLSIAHALCKIGEIYFEKKNLNQAQELARRAIGWERTSGRALILLWQATSQELWQRIDNDPKLMWTALATDLDALLHIFKSTTASHVASAPFLSKILNKMSAQQGITENYAILQKEFLQTFRPEKFDENIQKSLWASIFHATLLIQETPELNKSKFLCDVVAILVDNNESFEYITTQSKAAQIGYTSHQCEKCNAFFPTFVWKCTNCDTEETLRPMIYPDLTRSKVRI
ncbi:tetratricopeptide repeat protein [Fluviispira sanaruensis]|uniref:LapB rubredoxin metal binding domain-containing protein n=1 Tax=Fluviispira sanaruensis TaxID=2493639 RepID=A0A4P2VP12_FLUSA|nr:hypothetical protein [Fluviispira sanaruensis]BBH53934.1 hypothetical protein JCM31447_23870 [Fluviispira sanaruensis]